MTRVNHDKQSGKRERETPFWVTPRGARMAVAALHVVAGLTVLVELLFPFPEDGHAVERVHALDFSASYAVYGFTACVILVLLGIVLRRLVIRDEDYYRDGGR